MNFSDIINNAVAQVSATICEPKPRPRFVLPISTEDATTLLTQAYRAEVELRDCVYMNDQGTTTRLAAIGRWLTKPERKPWLLLYGATPGTGKSTTARAIARMINALYESLLNSIDAAVKALERQTTEHVSKMENPWPEHLRNITCYDDLKRRKEWRDAHPEEDKLIGEYETEKQEVIAAYKAPYLAGINKAQEQAAVLSGILPEYATAQGIADLVKEKNFGEYNRLTLAPFLIIDDIGTEPVAVKDFGNEVLPITELILKRYDKRLPTIITTNLPQSTDPRPGLKEVSIRAIYGIRVLDRLNEISDKLSYNGDSFRK